MAALKDTFEKLVSQLSEAERLEMLEKMRPLEGDPENRVLETAVNPDMGDDIIVLEEELKGEPLLYRIFLWLRAMFTGETQEQLFNDDKVNSLAKKINRIYPGLVDAKNKLLLNVFYEKLLELSKAAEFFKPYIDSLYEDIGSFYVFLGSFIVPEVTQQMNEEVDPSTLPLSKEVTGELRSSLVRKMEAILKGIPSEKRAYLYACARGIEWFRQFSHLPFARILNAFSTGIEGVCVARFESISTEMNTFSRVLCNGQTLPEEGFESIYLSTSKKIIPADSEAKDDDGRIREFMDKANAFMSVIHMFINTVPLKYLNKVVFNNISWQPAELTGAEDWFVKYRENWKKLFDSKWNMWLREKKKNLLHTQLSANFGIGSFPQLPDRPWAKMWNGAVVFHFELTSGFLCWFFQNKFNEVMSPLKTLLLEGVFINKENRAEFANAVNDIVQTSNVMSTFVEDMAPTGQNGIVFDTLEAQHLRSLQAQQKVDQIMLNAENIAQGVRNSFCTQSRLFINLLGGIIGEKKDTRYDGVSNIMSIKGNQNAKFREELKKSAEMFTAALDILKELETIDLPGGMSTI